MPSFGEGATESSSMLTRLANNWAFDWFWGLPLIVLNVLIHIKLRTLGLIDKQVTSTLSSERRPGKLSVAAIFAVGEAVLSVTILHALEGSIFGAGAYRILGALQDNKSAMLYSLNAMTSYGHENLHLLSRWELMGALESLNGWILFWSHDSISFSL